METERKKLKTVADTAETTQKLEDYPVIFKLNDDCMRHILSFLSVKDRIKIGGVCKNWQRIGKLPWDDVKELHVSFSTKSDEQQILYSPGILKQIIPCCGSLLTSLKLGNGREKGFNKPIMTFISNKCPNLKSLDLSGIVLTIGAAEVLAEKYRNLTSISLGVGWKGSEKGISTLFSSNKQLQSLTFRSSYFIRKCFSELPVDTVESLSFLGIDDSASDSIETKALQNFQKLRNFSLSGDNALFIVRFNVWLKVIPVKTGLESLCVETKNIHSIRNTFFENTQLEFANNMRSFTHLTRLSLDGDAILCDKVLVVIGQNCKHLSHVSLSDSCAVTDDGLKSLFESLNLQQIDLKLMNGISERSFAYIQMPLLEVFSCSFSSQINANEALKLLMLGQTNLKQISYVTRSEINLSSLIEEATAYVKSRTGTNILKVQLQNKHLMTETLQVANNLILEIQNRQEFPTEGNLNQVDTSESSSDDSDSDGSDDRSSASSDFFDFFLGRQRYGYESDSSDDAESHDSSSENESSSDEFPDLSDTDF